MTGKTLANKPKEMSSILGHLLRPAREGSDSILGAGPGMGEDHKVAAVQTFFTAVAE